jgi:hypothetical protein
VIAGVMPPERGGVKLRMLTPPLGGGHNNRLQADSRASVAFMMRVTRARSRLNQGVRTA